VKRPVDVSNLNIIDDFLDGLCYKDSNFGKCFRIRHYLPGGPDRRHVYDLDRYEIEDMRRIKNGISIDAGASKRIANTWQAIIDKRNSPEEKQRKLIEKRKKEKEQREQAKQREKQKEIERQEQERRAKEQHKEFLSRDLAYRKEEYIDNLYFGYSRGPLYSERELCAARHFIIRQWRFIALDEIPDYIVARLAVIKARRLQNITNALRQVMEDQKTIDEIRLNAIGFLERFYERVKNEAI
jgi:flagellar biosynthesis GTPase FlhF